MGDRAVVIGINTYPLLQPLEGPCNDAQAFKDWLLSPTGGGLSAPAVTSLCSSDFPPPADVTGAHPVLSELENLFRPLVTRATTQHTDGRLFVFVAGHGFADPTKMDAAALFAADAELAFPVHLAVVEYVEFLRRRWAFDEIILIMDSCRSTNMLHEVQTPSTLPRVAPHPRASQVKVFVAYATGFNQVARERVANGGGMRGIFTMALLDALHNAPPDDSGRVLGSSLKRYIHTVFEEHAGGVEVAPPEIRADEQSDVTFALRAASLLPVQFEVDAQHLGAMLVISTAPLDEVTRQPVIAGGQSVPLRAGLYKATIEGTSTSTLFEVPAHAPITL